MDYYPTTDIVMACFGSNSERPARVYGFESQMDNPRNQDPQRPRGTFLLTMEQKLFEIKIM
jgi:hypothetical protein